MTKKRRDYQIRIVDMYGEEEVLNYCDLDEARKEFWKTHDERTQRDGENSYEMELIEVLEQMTVDEVGGEGV